MKQGLKLYSRFIIALLLVFIAFTGCRTKKPTVMETDGSSLEEDTPTQNDSTKTYKKGDFRDGKVIAMYGVRHERLRQ